MRWQPCPARAQLVRHRTVTISGTSDTAAGDFCDFRWIAKTTITDRSISFGPRSNPTREIDHYRYQAVNINADTGVRVLEDDRYTVFSTHHLTRFKYVGNYWHLTTPNGKIVKVSAGQFVVEPFGPGVIKKTPHIDPGFADVICTVLGGSPAQG